GGGYLGAQLPVVAEQRAQAPRQRPDPVADGHGGQHALFEVHRRECHAPAHARGAESAAFTAEREKLAQAAAPADQVQAAVLETTAAKVGFEFADDESQ